MILEIVIILIVIFFSIILHECAHGWVAYKCGDPTAKLAGRLTLNPLKHIDPVGTILFPGILLVFKFLGYPVFLFGWAKPVPVNFHALRHPKRDMILVGASGPATNIMIAFCASYILKFNLSDELNNFLGLIVYFILLLAVFNLIPIPPLDGSRIVAGILPRPIDEWYGSLERYGLLIIFALLYFRVINKIIFPMIDFLGLMLGVRF